MNGRADSTKVLYIAGFTRSGSTILGRMLGALPGFFAAGELQHHFWRGIAENRACGCGQPLRQCLVWRPVIEAVYGSEDRALAHAPDVLALQRKLLRTRHLPRYSRRARGGPVAGTDLDAYARELGAIYREVAAVTKSRVIVDASKWAAHAAVLRLTPGVDARVVHVVRDPRAVAHSWSWPPRPGLGTYAPSHIALQWTKFNLAAAYVCRRAGSDRALRVRYEDLVSEPQRALDRITSLVDVPVPQLPLVGGNRLHIDTDHTVWGNPNRFKAGIIELSLDDAWVTQMSATSRRIVAGLALPIMHSFGYPPYRAQRKGES
jgi:hypothetical protein